MKKGCEKVCRMEMGKWMSEGIEIGDEGICSLVGRLLRGRAAGEIASGDRDTKSFACLTGWH